MNIGQVLCSHRDLYGVANISMPWSQCSFVVHQGAAGTSGYKMKPRLICRQIVIGFIHLTRWPRGKNIGICRPHLFVLGLYTGFLSS
jgi:hypothetical protein